MRTEEFIDKKLEEYAMCFMELHGLKEDQIGLIVWPSAYIYTIYELNNPDNTICIEFKIPRDFKYDTEKH